MKPVPTKKKRKQLDINGKPIESIGKIQASHTNWLQDSFTDANSSVLMNDDQTIESLISHSQYGGNLLLDVPSGIQDSIERLLHAAALRCYVPAFFHGVDDRRKADDREFTLDFTDDGDHIKEDNEGKIIRRPSPHSATDESSYEIYLKMPMGLAKMKYELECKRWSQVKRACLSFLHSYTHTLIHSYTHIHSYTRTLIHSYTRTGCHQQDAYEGTQLPARLYAHIQIRHVYAQR